MEVAHLAIPSPSHPGPFKFAEQLVEAQKSIGIEGRIIAIEDLMLPVPVGDVVVWHAIPDGIGMKLPGVFDVKQVSYLHAMPEYWLSWVFADDLAVLHEQLALTVTSVETCVTQSDRAARLWGRLLARKVRVVPPGVDLERWKPTGKTIELAGDPAVLCADTYSSMKNPFYVLDVLPEKAVLHIVGDESVKKALHPLRKHVQVHERRRDIDVLYRSAPITISSLPARFEEVSRVEMEAMACGSWACRPETVSEAVHEYKLSTRALSMAARELAEKRYDIKRTAEGMKEVYEEVLRK